MHGQVAQIRISLDHVKPTIWRRVEVPLSSTLEQLHRVVQAVMLFEDCHLFEFDVDGSRYVMSSDDDDTPTEDAGRLSVQTMIARGIKAFSYTYDFGDDWRHTIIIEQVNEANPEIVYPRFLAGARAAPPEDVGGVPGFENFVAAMTLTRHPDKARLRKWYGRSFDPEEIDAADIAARMKHLSA